MEISVESLLLELRELRAAVATALAPAPVSTLLLSEAWDQWLPLQSPQVQEKAASIWRCELHPILGDRPVVELIPSVLADWEAEMRRRGYAPKTISGAFALLSAACNLQVKNDRLPSLPWRAWRPRRPTVAKPRDAMRETSELSQLLKAAVAADVAAENRGYIGDLAKRICVASLQGLRQGELAGLGWEDVDFAANQMHVRRQALDSWRRYYPTATRCPALPKGGKARVLAMHPDVIDALDAQRARLRSLGIYADRGPVFPTRAGEWRSNGTCIRPEVFKTLVAGLDWPADGFVPHALRHSAATMELRSGADLRNVQAKLGHSSIEVTELYLHADRVPPPSSIGRVRGVRW